MDRDHEYKFDTYLVALLFRALLFLSNLALNALAIKKNIVSIEQSPTASYLNDIKMSLMSQYSHLCTNKLEALIHVHLSLSLSLGHKHRANLFIYWRILILDRIKLILNDLIFGLLDGQSLTRLDQLLKLFKKKNWFSKIYN